jgi:hypothetical protein
MEIGSMDKSKGKKGKGKQGMREEEESGNG